MRPGRHQRAMGLSGRRRRTVELRSGRCAGFRQRKNDKRPSFHLRPFTFHRMRPSACKVKGSVLCSLMVSPVDIIREAHAKAEAKVSRLRSSLEIAERELSETAIALRVFERASGGASTDSAASLGPTSEAILKHVGVGRANATAPKDIVTALEASGTPMGGDLVRTQLWRLEKRGVLRKQDGRYWILDLAQSGSEKAEAPEQSRASVGRVAELEGPEKTEQRPFRTGENVGSNPTPPTPYSRSAFDTDLDDDVPF
jgi:hypothetical protein